MRRVLSIALICLCSGLWTASAVPVVVLGPSPVVPAPFTGGSLITFEGLVEGLRINTQFPGITFSQVNASSPKIDNKSFLFAYESSSGVGVLTGSEDGGAVATTQGLIAAFAFGQTWAGAFISDTSPLGDYTITIFGSGGGVLESFTMLASTFPVLATPGCDAASPFDGTGCGNFIGFVRPTADIFKIQIGPSGAAAGTDAFSIDDFRFSALVPEPGTMLLVACGFLAAGLWRQRSRA